MAANARAGWAMGWLRPLAKAPQHIRRRYATEWKATDYLCGNCYFDLTDDD